MKEKNNLPKTRGKNKEGRRSGLENKFAEILKEHDVEEHYEVTKIPYYVPQQECTYKVDFTLPNGILIETKGFFRNYQERRKYELLKEQYPNIDLRFVFDNPQKKLSGTKTYADWAMKWGFKFCHIKDKDQIVKWLNERNYID